MTKPQGLPEIVTMEDEPLESTEPYDPLKTKLSADLVRSELIGGNVHLSGLSKVSIPGSTISNQYTGNGGLLTRYLLKQVTSIAQETNPNASGSEAYGWLPPPLFGEGEKVQSNWLYEFLLDPYPIRPATFLRMPKFNMSVGQFISTYVFSLDHKIIGLQFLFSTLLWFLVGGLLALGIRWQLAYPWQDMRSG